MEKSEKNINIFRLKKVQFYVWKVFIFSANEMLRWYEMNFTMDYNYVLHSNHFIPL